ncbi:Uncharacterised protein [Candidatus Bartonella washoeensis]|uniref:Uncharacterized protein n=1 Tax=Candidatus Bartonella washoeensis Sb944nv TaxID=1094563 RepID=J1J4P4_9HYPH|nr:hypothetical protein MCQ_01059 [Bartonella washoeensis Sb944nv]SPU27169.1 Uncharacterised protein [Bartonella washoeensis]
MFMKNAVISRIVTIVSIFLQIRPAQYFAKSETSFQASLISYKHTFFQTF